MMKRSSDRSCPSQMHDVFGHIHFMAKTHLARASTPQAAARWFRERTPNLHSGSPIVLMNVDLCQDFFCAKRLFRLHKDCARDKGFGRIDGTGPSCAFSNVGKIKSLFRERAMSDVSRRSALVITAAGLVAGATGAAVAQGSPINAGLSQALPKGVTRKEWGHREAVLPQYKKIEMVDLIFEPRATFNNPALTSDMVCHVPQGEVRIWKSDGTNFTAKEGDVWTCKKGQGESVENIGGSVAIIRSIQLLT
jgi:hypothetical protein